jgi:protein O-GlcNAc transferase
MALLSADEALALARADHRAGRLDAAERRYRDVLAACPGHAEALGALGRLALDAGRVDEATSRFDELVRASPGDLDANLALGALLHAQRKLDEAARAYRRALMHFPASDEVCARLGSVERERGDRGAAVEAYRRALAIRPGFWEASTNLGLTLIELDDPESGARHLRDALDAAPERAEIHYNLGVALQALGRLADAAACYRRAVALAPHFADAHNNLGAACKALGQLDDAVEAFTAALRLRPGWAAAHSNLAGVYEWQARHDDAMSHHTQAMTLAPTDAGIHGNYLFALLFHPRSTVESLRAAHDEWRRRHTANIARFTQWRNDRAANRRLRIGYVSGLFRDHVLGRYLWPLVRRHDRDEVDVYCYSNNRTNDAMTERFVRSATQWREIARMSDAQAAVLVRDDGIDILVDTSLHMEGNRLGLFACKPAPVQVTFAGYPGMTGVDAIDYRLTDPYLDPPVREDTRGERAWRLPATFWCYDPLGADVDVNPLPALSAGHVTFGCLNNFAKTNASLVRLWSRVLAAVPRARLLVLAHPGRHQQELRERVNGYGVDASRVDFVAYGPRSEYLTQFRRVDISLDTHPYNGHTTGLDSLWMGVPVVTLVGDTVVGRAGLSQLSNLGTAEWIASTPDDYVALASRLAGDLPLLAEWRRTLRARMEASPLMDTGAFARGVEAAYRGMWRRYCSSD